MGFKFLYIPAPSLCVTITVKHFLGHLLKTPAAFKDLYLIY